MEPVDILDVKEPLVGDHQAGVLGLESRQDTAAPVVTADDDVLHLEHHDRVLEDAQAVEVGRDDLVGDVAVDEDVAGIGIHHGLRGNAAVRASDPEELGTLLLGKRLEVLRIAAAHLLRPGLVLKEEPLGRGLVVGCRHDDRRRHSGRRHYACRSEFLQGERREMRPTPALCGRSSLPQPSKTARNQAQPRRTGMESSSRP